MQGNRQSTNKAGKGKLLECDCIVLNWVIKKGNNEKHVGGGNESFRKRKKEGQRP